MYNSNDIVPIHANSLSTYLYFSKIIARITDKTGAMTINGKKYRENVHKYSLANSKEQAKNITAIKKQIKHKVSSFFLNVKQHSSFAKYPNIDPMKKIGILA